MTGKFDGFGCATENVETNGCETKIVETFVYMGEDILEVRRHYEFFCHWVNLI